MRGSGILLVTIAIALFSIGCVPVAEVEAMKRKWDDENQGLKNINATLANENARLMDDNSRLNGDYMALKTEYDKYAQKLGEYKNKTNLDWRQVGDTIVVRLPNQILFDSGKTYLKPEYLSTLNKVGEILREDFANGLIRVEGHTDNVPIVRNKDKFPSNWELSCHRACEVAKYLIKRGYKSPRQVYAAGHGQYKPIASNASSSGKAKNRRVEIVILPPKSMACADGGKPMATAIPDSELGPEDVVPADTIPLK
ncbi:MAG: OmpA/MotB family protein [Planctomycetota bacterium]|jgi:chemotaxis protein MotB